MCKLAQTELMVVIAWTAIGVGPVASGSIVRIIGIVLLGLLVLLLAYGAYDTWKNERKLRAAARASRREDEIDV